MADTKTVEAAKKATAIDKAGILAAIKAAYPGSDVFGDDVLAGLVSDALSGAMDAPADPMMPGATTTPGAPAVPFASSASAEDEAKKVAATAAADEVETLKKENETLAAKLKATEAQLLSGKIINANAADRKPAPVLSYAERIRTTRNAALGAASAQ